MRILVTLIISSLLSIVASSQHYQPIDNLSSIQFSIKNFGINVDGSFKGIKAEIRFNEANINSASFNATIDVNSIQTGNEARDKHLRKEEYFNVAKYPTIQLVSKQVLLTEVKGTFMMVANLYIKGIAKEIRFPFMYTFHSEGILFSGQFKMNRRDFSVGGSSMILSDHLLVKLSVFAKNIIVN
jgi:polyisoprenoid-binding protein YceI